jgi:hypothetical protein
LSVILILAVMGVRVEPVQTTSDSGERWKKSCCQIQIVETPETGSHDVEDAFQPTHEKDTSGKSPSICRVLS